MKKIFFLLSSFVLIVFSAGCSTIDASQDSPPVSDFQKDEISLNVYKNDEFGFSLKYPISFSVNSLFDTESNTLLTLVYPTLYNVGTNLQSAKILVSASKKSADVSTCLVAESTGKPLTATKEIHGQTFYTEAWSEGAAGHVGDQVQYSTVASGACYKITFQGYATNLSLLNQDGQKAVAYDKAALVSVFEDVVGSFLLN